MCATQCVRQSAGTQRALSGRLPCNMAVAHGSCNSVGGIKIPPASSRATRHSSTDRRALLFVLGPVHSLFGLKIDAHGTMICRALSALTAHADNNHKQTITDNQPPTGELGVRQCTAALCAPQGYPTPQRDSAPPSAPSSVVTLCTTTLKGHLQRLWRVRIGAEWSMRLHYIAAGTTWGNL